MYYKPTPLFQQAGNQSLFDFTWALWYQTYLAYFLKFQALVEFLQASVSSTCNIMPESLRACSEMD